MSLAFPVLGLFLVGYYEPQFASRPDICPQYVRRASETEISVVYVGDCYWQGPFRYECFGSRCLSSDGQVSFEWTGETTPRASYRWTNRAYSGFEAEMVWIAPRPPER
jgi:hypothetical protein